MGTRSDVQTEKKLAYSMLELDQQYFCKAAVDDMQANIKSYTPKDILVSLLNIFMLNSAEARDLNGEPDESIIKLSQNQST